MKKSVFIGWGCAIAGLALVVLLSRGSALAQEKKVSAKPRMIEVEESAWVKLNQDLLKMQDELIKAETDAKMTRAELERERLNSAAAKTGAKASRDRLPVHRVQKKENLWKIARKYYNDPFKWRWIFKANIRQIENPNRIFPEMVLDIPRY
jgi:hypothetical protein